MSWLNLLVLESTSGALISRVAYRTLQPKNSRLKSADIIMVLNVKKIRALCRYLAYCVLEQMKAVAKKSDAESCIVR